MAPGSSLLEVLQIVLSSAVLLCRVCILWPKSRALKIISGILVFCIARTSSCFTSLSGQLLMSYHLVMLAISTGAEPVGSIEPETSLSSITFWNLVGTEFADVFGTTGIALVFFTTLLFIVLVLVKIW